MVQLRKGDRVYTGNFGFATVHSMRRDRDRCILVMPDDASAAYGANAARGTPELGGAVRVPLSYCTRLTRNAEHYVSHVGAIDYRLKGFTLDMLRSGHSVSKIRRMFANAAILR